MEPSQDRKPACKLHPETSAEGSCGVCLESFCRICLETLDLQRCCAPCAAKLRRRRKLLNAGAIGLGVCAGLAIFLYSFLREHQTPTEPTEDSRSPAEIRLRASLERDLEREPCNRPKMEKLSKALMRAGEYRLVIDRTRGFVQRCGKFNYLLWKVLAAHKKLSEWQEAIAVATQLINDDPHDKDFRYWRGKVYEQLERWSEAAEDYRQAILLQPRVRGIPENLANAYEKMGRPCDAIQPLEQLLYAYLDSPRKRQPEAVARLRRRIEAYYRDPHCQALAGNGSVTFRRGEDQTFSTPVRVGAGRAGRFIVDTGAALVALSRSFAQANGVNATGPRVLLHTATDIVPGSLTMLSEVRVPPSLVAKTVSAVILDSDIGQNIDGLLGLSFLGRFAVQLEAGGERMVIRTPR
jgi:aspartyl protease family protein